MNSSNPNTSSESRFLLNFSPFSQWNTSRSNSLLAAASAAVNVTTNTAETSIPARVNKNHNGKNPYPPAWKPVQWIRTAHSVAKAETEYFLLNQGTTTATTTVDRSPFTESVHLKLNPPKRKKGDKDPPTNESKKKKTTSTTVKVHSFRHPKTGLTYQAINTPKRKFAAFLQYKGALPSEKMPNLKDVAITTRKYTWNSKHSSSQEELRHEWRTLWKQERLITDRTEFLAVYPSDEKTKSQRVQDESNERLQPASPKRGGFVDLLHLYRERLVAILKDEQADVHAVAASKQPMNNLVNLWNNHHHFNGDSQAVSNPSLLSWLKEQYDPEKVEQLLAENFQHYPVSEQMAMLKEFLSWFRSYFPYFYDKCGTCGASIREEFPDLVASNNSNNDEESDEQGEGCISPCHTFMGYVYPNTDELDGKASRTELYQCHKCSSWTRFARFNSARYVMKSRQGRCGEYSMLLYRFLRALDHEARWVVDWADHVWAEVYVENQWVHLDPCEAAVGENLIYEGWGKKQTYILAFYAPMPGSKSSNTPHQTPLIEDVTAQYTSESEAGIQKRREESKETVQSSISEAIENLQINLQELEGDKRWQINSNPTIHESARVKPSTFLH